MTDKPEPPFMNFGMSGPITKAEPQPASDAVVTITPEMVQRAGAGTKEDTYGWKLVTWKIMAKHLTEAIAPLIQSAIHDAVERETHILGCGHPANCQDGDEFGHPFCRWCKELSETSESWKREVERERREAQAMVAVAFEEHVQYVLGLSWLSLSERQKYAKAIRARIPADARAALDQREAEARLAEVRNIPIGSPWSAISEWRRERIATLESEVESITRRTNG